MVCGDATRDIRLGNGVHHIEVLKVSNATSDKLLYRVLPMQKKGTCKVLYHTDNKVENMEVPSMEL